MEQIILNELMNNVRVEGPIVMFMQMECVKNGFKVFECGIDIKEEDGKLIVSSVVGIKAPTFVDFVKQYVKKDGGKWYGDVADGVTFEKDPIGSYEEDEDGEEVWVPTENPVIEDDKCQDILVGAKRL